MMLAQRSVQAGVRLSTHICSRLLQEQYANQAAVAYAPRLAQQPSNRSVLATWLLIVILDLLIWVCSTTSPL